MRLCFSVCNRRFLTGVIMFMLLYPMSVFAVQGQITVQGKAMSIKQAIQVIEKNSKYTFFYKAADLSNAKIRDIHCEGSIEEVLNVLFKDSGISYVIKDNEVILKSTPVVVATPQQSNKIVVKGNIRDTLGESVIGATIMEKNNAQNGSISDINGDFSLSVSPGAVIVISYIGYVTQELKAIAGAPLKVVLKDDSRTLDEVVVVGFGSQKKANLTGAVSSIKMDEIIGDRPIMTASDALQGTVPGLLVSNSGNAPGSGKSFQLRGAYSVGIKNSDGSYGANVAPLILIDNVEGSLDMLNPEDIETVTVLKDAASAAVYGSRAANGVVLVTTKQGAIGKVKVSYDFSYGWQSAWKKRSMLNASEYATLMNEAQQYSNGTDRFSNTNLGVGTDWQDVLFNDGAPVQNHQLSISGANEKVSYYFSAGYYNQEGIIGGNYDRSNYERLSFRSNTLYTLFDETKNRSWLRKMTVGVNMSYSRINNIGVSAGNLTGSPLGDALFLDPTMEVYAQDEDHVNGYTADIRSKYGDPVRDQLTGQVLQIPENFNEITNPLGRMSAQPGRKNNSDKVIANLTAELGIWDNLKYKFSWGSDLAFWGYDEWNHPYYLGRNCNQSIADGRSSVMSEMNRGYTWQIENVLTYDKTISQHTFNVVLGQSAERNTGRRLYGMAKDLIAYMGDKANIDFTTSLPNNGNRNTEGGLTDPHSLASYFGRLSYNFAERYMLQLTVRRDGSSRFGENNKWGTFPSVSLGWNLTNESFMEKRPDWLTSTKIRLSWGKNGNEAIGNFRYTANVSMNNNYPFGAYGRGQQIVMGSKPSGTPNADLMWEESEQYDAGIDFGFLGNALTFTVDYYQKKTNGMLKEMAIPNYLGESKPWGNVGSMKNEGVEFEVGYKYSHKDFRFGVNANLSYLKNKLVDLGTADGFEMMDQVHILGNVGRAENGMPYPYFYGYKTAGIFQNQAEIDAYTNSKGEKLQPLAVPGDVKFVDFDNDGTIDDKDKTMIGKGTPDWTFGLNLTAAYKDIDFSVLFSGSLGQDIMDVTRRLDVSSVNVPQEFMKRWHGEGTSNTMPRFCYPGDDMNGNWKKVSDLYVHNGSFARIKNMQIGYTLPKNLTRKFFVDRLRLYVAAENLLTLTSYKGLDPEINATDVAGDKSNGIDRGYYPQARTFTVGLNLNF